MRRKQSRAAKAVERTRVLAPAAAIGLALALAASNESDAGCCARLFDGPIMAQHHRKDKQESSQELSCFFCGSQPVLFAA